MTTTTWTPFPMRWIRRGSSVPRNESARRGRQVVVVAEEEEESNNNSHKIGVATASAAIILSVLRNILL